MKSSKFFVIATSIALYSCQADIGIDKTEAIESSPEVVQDLDEVETEKPILLDLPKEEYIPDLPNEETGARIIVVDKVPARKKRKKKLPSAPSPKRKKEELIRKIEVMEQDVQKIDKQVEKLK